MVPRVNALETLLGQLQDQYNGLVQKVAALEGSLWQKWTDPGSGNVPPGAGGGFVGVVTTAVTAMNFTTGALGTGVVTVQKNVSGSLANVSTGRAVLNAIDKGVGYVLTVARKTATEAALEVPRSTRDITAALAALTATQLGISPRDIGLQGDVSAE